MYLRVLVYLHTDDEDLNNTREASLNTIFADTNTRSIPESNFIYFSVIVTNRMTSICNPALRCSFYYTIYKYIIALNYLVTMSSHVRLYHSLAFARISREIIIL